MRFNAIARSIAVCVLGGAIFCGCATQSLRLSVTRPAEVNLKGFDKIAIGDITGGKGGHSKDISDQITTALFDSKRFEVLDRQNIGTLMQEHNLNASGLVDASTAAELGKFVGAAVLVFGRIQTDKYDENVETEDGWTDKQGNYHKRYWRKGQFTLSVHLSVVDLKTSKILAIKDLSASFKDQESEDKKEPEPINVDAMYTKCLSTITADFMRMIAPYQVVVVAKFVTDGKVPEFEQSIAHFKAGDWDGGITVLDGVAKRQDLTPILTAKAVYNMGLAQMYSGRYDESMQNLQKAVTLDPKKSMYLNALSDAKREKANADKLQQQQ